MNVYLVPHSISQRTEWHSGSHNDPDWSSLYWAVDYVFGVVEAPKDHYGGRYVPVGGEIRSARGNTAADVWATLIELGFSEEEANEACDHRAASKFVGLRKKHEELLAAERELQRAQERLRKAKR